MTHHRLDANKVQQWFEDNRQITFSWGTTDCCLVTCDFVNHMVGIDPAEKHRGQYDSELSAKKALLTHGSIEDSFDNHFERVEYNFTHRSDIILYESEIGKTLGIKWANGVVSVHETGLVVVHVKKDDVLACWRICE